MNFVVMAQAGEYSDRRVWVVACLECPQTHAQKYVERASRLSRALWEKRKEVMNSLDWESAEYEACSLLDDRTLDGEPGGWATVLDPHCNPMYADGPTTYWLEAVPRLMASTVLKRIEKSQTEIDLNQLYAQLNRSRE